MYNKYLVALVFGIFQFLLLSVAWGGFEYSILAGDMTQHTNISFSNFVFGQRILYYFIFSLINFLLFSGLSVNFSSNFHPGFFGAIVLAVCISALVVPLSFVLPYQAVSITSFVLATGLYLTTLNLISKIKRAARK